MRAIRLISAIIFIAAVSLPARTIRNGAAQCLECHSDRSSGAAFIGQTAFASSVHGRLDCTDCHDESFEEFPHAQTSEGLSCMDCHSGKSGTMGVDFDAIDSQFSQSIHKTRRPDFRCTGCHNPHSFQAPSRRSSPSEVLIKDDNSVCLGCHKRDNKDILKRHGWLPHAKEHVSSLRCIDCHADQSASGEVVSHKIEKSSRALKECARCHQRDSYLLHSLYKFRREQQMNQKGFFNPVILNDSYVIGATRNYYLNLASIAIAAITLLAIAVHATLLWKSKKK